MSVAKVTEISATSPRSFEDAIRQGVARASKTLNNVSGAWVNEMKMDIKDGEVVAWRVFMKVSFILDD